MDKIKIQNLQIFAKHGVYPEENVLGQKFVVSAVMYTDTRKAGCSDELEHSTNYGEVSHYIKNFVEGHTFKLIETVAEKLAEGILFNYPLIQKIDLEISKPWAPVGLPLDTVAVQITRGWHTAYIALGSNLGNKKAYLDMAVEMLSARKDCVVEKVAEYLETAPYGGVEQDDFLNSALQMKTLLPPEELLDVLHEIEQAGNRERLIHWGPRTLDLDILLYDDLVYSSETLTIPHIEIQKRDFVLKPMTQIAAYKRHPILQKTMQELLNELPDCQS